MGGLISAEKFSRLIPYAGMFGQGLVITIMLSVGTVLVGFVLGIVLAVMRMSDVRPFRFLGVDKNGRLRGPGFLTALSKFNPLSLEETVTLYRLLYKLLGREGSPQPDWAFLECDNDCPVSCFKKDGSEEA